MFRLVLFFRFFTFASLPAAGHHRPFASRSVDETFALRSGGPRNVYICETGVLRNGSIAKRVFAKRLFCGMGVRETFCCEAGFRETFLFAKRVSPNVCLLFAFLLLRNRLFCEVSFCDTVCLRHGCSRNVFSRTGFRDTFLNETVCL